MPKSELIAVRSPEHGLIGWLENTRVALPLKGVEVRFEVVGEVAHVELDQIYHQTAAQALDCLYSFPLPAEAAVHRCEFHVNDRVISARVEELQKARELYDEARRSGKRAALLEGERANLFTLNLANVQPEDLVVVRLAYVQTLERVGRERRLRIPFCPGIRYCPGRPLMGANQGRGVVDDTTQVPDASRISPPRIDALHRDAAYLSIDGVLKISPPDFGGPTTRSHLLRTTIETNQVRVELDQEGAVPDQDFLLGWELPTVLNLSPRAWTTPRDGWTYSLVELRAPVESVGIRREPLDVYFLLDRSGSMEGIKWVKACQASDRLLKRLGEGDRVQVTCFESRFRDLLPRPQSATEFARAWPTDRIVQLGTEGGTELLPALQHVVTQVEANGKGRKPILVLITDGQVANEQVVVEALRSHPRLVLHAFGIDTVVNDALLTEIARQQRGSCVMLRPDEDIPAAVGRLGSLLASPVVTDLQIPDGWETADGPLPDLYVGQTESAVIRGRRAMLPETWVGRDPSGRETSIRLIVQETASPAVPLLWARRRIRSLESRHDLVAALPLAKEFNLVCQGAAFVAWDEVERVAVASKDVYQPSLEPAGWGIADPSDRRTCLMRACGRAGRGGPLADLPTAGLTDSDGDTEMGMFATQSYRSETSNYLRAPLRPPPWANHPMFRAPLADQVVALITEWLDSISGLRRRLAERRLKKLIAAVARDVGPDPVIQLKEFAQRLSSLFGTTGPFANRLETIRQNAR
ncbi:MAG TPA: VIT domain-containing protein [Verrucomicrobiota bacterium]|nr:hypothetical protein [Verrucomicrobiales bacterium]HRI14238.1 VIT domain-containing protein [Verrucomicrobiota bacterium]